LAEAEPIVPRLLNPSVPRDLATICLKCLEKDMSRRYPTAQALAEELERFLRGQPILARPIGLAGKAGRWCRRSPKLAAVTAVAMLGAVLGLTGILWQLRRAVAGELSARQNAYAADMNGVQTALANGDLGEALACLDRHRPAPGQSDLRGWEWRYFWQRCRSDEEFLLHRYSNSVAALAFSSDGKWLAVRRERGAVALWDTGARKSVLDLPGSGPYKALALSPRGNLLAYGSVGSNATPAVSLWNVTSRQASQLPHSSAPARLAFSPDGNFLASWATDGMVRLWQIESRLMITNAQRFSPAHEFLGRILFSPADRWLAIGETNIIQLWDWASGRQRTIRLPKTCLSYSALAFTPDGRLLAAACDQVIQVWDVAKVWDLPAHRDVPSLGPPFEQSSHIFDLALAPDNQILATAGVDQTVRLWDLHRRQEIRRYRGNTHEVWAVAFSPDGRQLVSGGRDGTVRYWDPAGKPPPPPYEVLPIPVWGGAFSFSPDGKRFVGLNCTNSSAPPGIWDTTTLREVERLEFLGTNNSVVKWSPDGRLIAVGDSFGNVRVGSLSAHRLLTNFVNEGRHVGSIKFYGRGRSLWCGLVSPTPPYRRAIRLWSVADWRELHLPGGAVQDPMWAAMSPDNRTFAILDADGTVAWWDLASGRRLAQFPHHFASVDGYLAFSPDGRTLAGSAREGLVSLWNVAAPRILATVRSNVRFTYGVAFSPDGQRLLCGGGDPGEVVRLMDVASRRFVANLPGEPDEYWLVEMSADGNTLAAVGTHGTALLWRAPSWAEIQAAEKRAAVP
jgi:WD40 repeat protein